MVKGKYQLQEHLETCTISLTRTGLTCRFGNLETEEF
jgi:hypothetical protein